MGYAEKIIERVFKLITGEIYKTVIGRFSGDIPRVISEYFLKQSQTKQARESFPNCIHWEMNERMCREISEAFLGGIKKINLKWNLFKEHLLDEMARYCYKKNYYFF